MSSLIRGQKTVSLARCLGFFNSWMCLDPREPPGILSFPFGFSTMTGLCTHSVGSSTLTQTIA